MKTVTGVSFVAVLVLAGAVASAHEGGVHVMGIVVSIGDASLVVKDRGGTETTVVLDSATTFEKEKGPAVRADVRPGDRAVVHARKVGGRLVATEVRFSHPSSSGPGPGGG